MPELEYIPLEKIRVNQIALRDVNRESENFQEIRNSIAAEGVVNAINVRRKKIEPDDGKEFELVDGLQRFTAATDVGSGVKGMAGVIPAQIIEREDAEALITQIVGNAQRIETKPVEYAKGLMRLLGYNPTWTESQLASRLNKSPAWIGKQLGLLKLHDQLKPLVNENKISVANAYILTKLPHDEQLLWLDRAQTMPHDQFSLAATERSKAIRDANRKGVDAGEEQFVPVSFLRKKPELEAESQNPEVGPAIVKDLNITQGLKANQEGLNQAAARGFQLGLQWALNFDPKSIEIQKQKDSERRKKDEEAKIRREAEKKAKRADEQQKKSAEAQKAADDAKRAVEGLPAAVGV